MTNIEVVDFVVGFVEKGVVPVQISDVTIIKENGFNVTIVPI